MDKEKGSIYRLLEEKIFDISKTKKKNKINSYTQNESKQITWDDVLGILACYPFVMLVFLMEVAICHSFGLGGVLAFMIPFLYNFLVAVFLTYLISTSSNSGNNTSSNNTSSNKESNYIGDVYFLVGFIPGTVIMGVFIAVAIVFLLIWGLIIYPPNYLSQIVEKRKIIEKRNKMNIKTQEENLCINQKETL
ncbi:MAG: hypothetical protein ACK4GJ_01790 [bacterium]